MKSLDERAPRWRWRSEAQRFKTVLSDFYASSAGRHRHASDAARTEVHTARSFPVSNGESLSSRHRLLLLLLLVLCEREKTTFFALSKISKRVLSCARPFSIWKATRADAFADSILTALCAAHPSWVLLETSVAPFSQKPKRICKRLRVSKRRLRELPVLVNAASIMPGPR